MADRIFAGVLLLVAIGYTVIAFTVIHAPFQYDPLGPESWPRILGVVAIPCILFVLAKPDVARLGLPGKTWRRLAALIVMLFAYAYLFQPLGFILATFAFCMALSLMLGARLVPALAFSAGIGIVGYFLCTKLLDLNLPAGVLTIFR
ncbi:tripartite tricarboxylate transporter TctB family protein [Jiella avicenniae]|uniref:Tripartite tricarboxylate transporter TctB family protein n=1 Tax=Jiella avicenniae TaxID=2907202 RepID=A0A9X1P3V9_9HYPH|nr:tripartite tricarboxylate transporter TctB family protein [Jiella avicenniae]MCE7027749.1 tripartite tricarboxylate transporter TctB family protein [Jiella avicenniae]MCE7028791.1 tripartite tricarboxylate transporter TctB family protein [Jiella avicenniae]